MTTDSVALVRDFHSGIWAGEMDLFDEHVADAYVVHDPNVPGDLHGPAAFREYISASRPG